MLGSSDPFAAESGGRSDGDGGALPVSASGGGGNRWPRQETVALIKIRTGMDVAFRDASLKGPLWDEVSRKLGELGYRRSPKKCREKFENVSKYHKRTKDGRATKSEGKAYRFFDQLTALDTQPPPPQPPPHHPQKHHQTPTTSATPLKIAMPLTNPSIAPPFSTISSTQNLAQFQNPAFSISFSAPIPPTNQNPTPVSSSSATSSDEEAEKPSSKKRKWEDFFRKLTSQVMAKQEEIQKNFLDELEKHEKDQSARNEAWRTQELARISQEREILAEERAVAAAKDAALFAFLQKISASDQQTQNLTQTDQKNNAPPRPPPPPSEPVCQQLTLEPPQPPTSKSAQTPPPLLPPQIPQLRVSRPTPIFVVPSPQPQPPVSVMPPPQPPASKSSQTLPLSPLLPQQIPHLSVSGPTPVSVVPPPQPHASKSRQTLSLSPPPPLPPQQIPHLSVSGPTPVSVVPPPQPPASKSRQTLPLSPPPLPPQQIPHLSVSGPTPVSVVPPPQPPASKSRQTLPLSPPPPLPPQQIPHLSVSRPTPVSVVPPPQPPASKSAQTLSPPLPLQPQQIPQLPVSSAHDSRKTNMDNRGEIRNFNSNPSSSRWPKSEIESLIKLRTNLDLKYQENVPKGPLWEEISAGMLRLGYNRNAKRCKEKWENINKYYKKVKESNKKRPEDSKTCPYFTQLEAIYKERYKSNGNVVAPIMAKPERQWPVQVQNRPELPLMEGHDSHDDMDEDDD